jgi:proteic killer suppression protein
VIRSFRDRGSEDIFHGHSTAAARRLLPMTLVPVARRKLMWLHAAARIEDLRRPPGNRLEALKRDRAGEHSIRINEQYRICFVWTAGGAEQVQVTDYH